MGFKGAYPGGVAGGVKSFLAGGGEARRREGSLMDLVEGLSEGLPLVVGQAGLPVAMAFDEGVEEEGPVFEGGP